jgi:phenylpyruvate tautomerase PptA (4-oxalocrotonate tautomerase family)
MPILDVEIITRPGEVIGPHLASELARRAGLIFGSPPGGTWVKVHSLASEYYAENDDNPGSSIYPVFVSVLKARRPSPIARQKEVEQLTTAVTQVCHRPAENVHIIYLSDGTGRIAFGDKMVSKG